jgi:copper chaperone CopZ
MAVEKAVREVDGVDSVQVDLGKAQADYTGTADPEKVKAAIKEAGYEPQ